VQNDVRENLVVGAMFVTALAALLWRTRWVRIGSPIVLLALLVAYMVQFYPVLR
jgi:hypothetical protein